MNMIASYGTSVLLLLTAAAAYFIWHNDLFAKIMCAAAVIELIIGVYIYIKRNRQE